MLDLNAFVVGRSGGFEDMLLGKRKVSRAGRKKDILKVKRERLLSEGVPYHV